MFPDNSFMYNISPNALPEKWGKILVGTYLIGEDSHVRRAGSRFYIPTVGDTYFGILHVKK
jgi:hypothetical protein